jgi:hypothetical protein
MPFDLAVALDELESQNNYSEVDEDEFYRPLMEFVERCPWYYGEVEDN